MHFEAKKKLLSAALANVRAITAALEIEDGSPAVRLLTAKKRLKVATVYAEATVADVTVKEDGEAIVDMQSLQQALSVGGDLFKFQTGKKNAAQFQCGRSKGPVSLREDGFHDSVLKKAPKAVIHLAGLKDLLVNLALKGEAGDRTLHFDPKEGTVRGESSDGYRGVVVTAKAGESKEFEAVSLSLLQKACDTLGKLVGDSNLGFDENFLSVQTPGFKAVVPLSADPPLEIKSQLAGWLETQVFFGSFTIKVKELKDALADAQSMVGANIQAILDLNLSGKNTNATITGKAEAGDIETSLSLESTDLKTEFAMQVPAAGLQDCLNFYKDDVIKISVYSEALVLDLLQESDWIESQTTTVPLVAEIDADVPGSDEEEAPKPKKPKKKTATKKKPDPEPEEDEDEEELPNDEDDDDAPIDDDDEDIDDLEDDEDFDDDEE